MIRPGVAARGAIAPPDAPSGSVRLRALLATAAVGLLLGNLVAEAARGIWNTGVSGVNDWIPFASAARLLAHGSRCLYCAAQLSVSEATFLGHAIGAGQGTLPIGAGHYLPFVNPPPAALLLVPLALLPPVLGFALFTGLSLLAMAATYRILTGALGCPRLPTLLAVLAVPGSFGLALGQWGAILTLALAVAVWALRRRPILCGLCLALLLVKPQYVWLVPVALVVTRRWRVALGLAAGALLIALASLALVGPAGLLAWVRLSLATSNGQVGMSSGLPALVTGALGVEAGWASVLAGAALVTLGAIRYRDRMRAHPEMAVAAFACLSLLLCLHVLSQDYLLVAPALALAARVRPGLATAAAVLISVAFLGDFQVGFVDVWSGGLALALAALVAVAGLFPPASPSPLLVPPPGSADTMRMTPASSSG